MVIPVLTYDERLGRSKADIKNKKKGIFITPSLTVGAPFIKQSRFGIPLPPP